MPATEQIMRLRPNGQKIVLQSPDFQKGFQVGYCYYLTTCSQLPLLDIGIYEFLVGVMTSVRHSGRWNTGFIVGWIAALLDHQEEEEQTSVPAAIQEEEIPTC